MDTKEVWIVLNNIENSDFEHCKIKGYLILSQNRFGMVLGSIGFISVVFVLVQQTKTQI